MLERAAPTADELVRQLLELPHDEARRARLQRELATGARQDELLTALKDVSERQLGADTAVALATADLLVFAADVARQPEHRAMGLLARADALRVQGKLPAAVTAYDQAATLAKKLRQPVTWARTRTGWVLAMHYVGRGQEVLGTAEEALQVLLDHHEYLRAGALSLNTGLVCYELGQYGRSLQLYQRAQLLYERAVEAQPELADVAEERIAKAKANMAVNQALLGDFDQAISLYEAARDVFERHGEQDAKLRVEHYIAALYAGQGQLTRALRVHADALAAAERAGLADTVVEVSLEMIRCYAGLNRHTDALELSEQLIARCEASASPTEAAKARLAAARALAALGEVEPALSQLTSAAAIFSETGQEAGLAETALLRARLQLAEHDWPASVASAQDALLTFAERGLTVPRAQAELVLAHAQLEQHHPVEATAHAEAALDLTQERGLLPLSHQAHHVLGRVADQAGNETAALAEYDAAIADLERVQSRLATELRVEFLGDKLALFNDAIDASLRADQPHRAFGYLERAKSRALVDYLTSNAEVHIRADDPAEQALLDELAALRAEHHWFYTRLHGLSAETDAPGAIERGALNTAVKEREKSIGRVLERLALLRDAEGLEALGGGAPASAVAPPNVPDGSVLLEYLLRDDHGLVFVVTAGELHATELRAGGREIRRLLGRWQVNLDAVARALRQGESLVSLSHNARGILHALYRALIEPVANQLEGAERLVIIPYGPAHAVPFHALFDGTRHLIEYLRIASAPSSALLGLSERRPRHTGRGALVVGHSHAGELPGVLAEARAVAALMDSICLLEAEATCAAVIDNAPRRDIVHLAAHGEARLDNPLFAHLNLADGQLSMVDVFNLRLDGALVTLSACETGRSAVRGGDELVGLTRGFLFAGAATLVQSLWRVDDSSTPRLMQAFYTGLTSGLPPGGALRAAQRSMLDEGLHPHLWGAFQLVGRDGHHSAEDSR
ncbi:MAG TPA: CHAT domain-containing protein [Chloroflexota bacterium]